MPYSRTFIPFQILERYLTELKPEELILVRISNILFVLQNIIGWSSCHFDQPS